MKDFENAYFTGESKVTEKQRKSINRFTITKPKKAKIWGNGGYAQNKKKYWCPINNDFYFGSIKKVHCPLCYSNYNKIDKHEVIKYEGQDK